MSNGVGYTAFALYDYQAGMSNSQKIILIDIIISNYANILLIKYIYSNSFFFCYSADSDEISFDPDDIITGIEMVNICIL